MKLRPFELALVSIFAVMAVLAVTLLALYSPSEDPDPNSVQGPVLIWGTLPVEPMEQIFLSLVEQYPTMRQVEYEYVPQAEFNQRFITALADRTNPDLVLLPHEELVPQRSRLVPFTEEQFSLRSFRDRFIDGTEVFALADGIYALPVAVDPLVLFWNRTLLGNAGFLNAPASWEELMQETVPKLTVREFDRTVNQAAIAMGEAENLVHLTPVLSMLTMQGGSSLVTEENGVYRLRLDESTAGGRPFASALEFFMRFSNPSGTYYSWNRAQSLDRDAFIQERLALYFAFASEGRSLLARNPNMNFDVAEVPKGEAVPVRRTYGRMYGLSVVRSANNPAGAYGALSILSGDAAASQIATTFGMAPASRAGLAVGNSDVFGSVAFKAAPVARAWLMPGSVATTRVFSEMIRVAATDRATIPNAAGDGINRLRLEY